MTACVEHLEAKYWVETIICHPELEDQCPWEMLGSSAWHDILMERPEFIRHAPRKITLSFMTANQWLEVLIAHPELGSYVPSGRSLFNRDSDALSRLWGTLLSRHPEFAKYEPWKRLRRDEWRRVLSQHPQFINNYERDRSKKNTWQFTLTLNDQAEIIACQPSLFERFKTETMPASGWMTILFNQPQFREKCNLNKIDPYFLGCILKRHPEWRVYCETYSRTQEDILRIAENFPEVLNFYELDRFREIGIGDTPWIEKHPCLVPYTYWDFSYSYWDVIMTHCSDWLATKKRPYINVLATDFSSTSSKEKGHGRRGTNGRRMASKHQEKNLRNSLDSIMDWLYWVSPDITIYDAEVIPKHIRDIIADHELTYEQLMIKMSMMSPEDCGKVLFGLFIADAHEFIWRMLVKDLAQAIQMVPLKYILPLLILFEAPAKVSSVLYELSMNDKHAVADFRDAAGNNVWHYYFFRNPLYRPSKETPEDLLELLAYKRLIECGGSRDTPNNMGFSYNQITQAMKDYLGVEK